MGFCSARIFNYFYLRATGSETVFLLIIMVNGEGCAWHMSISSDSNSKSEPPGKFQQYLFSLCQNNAIALGCSKSVINYIEL